VRGESNRKLVRDPSRERNRIRHAHFAIGTPVSAARLPPVLLALPLSLPLSSIGAKVSRHTHTALLPSLLADAEASAQPFCFTFPLPPTPITTQQLHIGTDTRTTSLAPTPVLNLFALRASARGGDPRARRGTRLGRSRCSRDPRRRDGRAPRRPSRRRRRRRGGNVRREGKERRLEMRWRVGPKLPTPLRRLHLVHRDASGARPGHCGAFSQDRGAHHNHPTRNTRSARLSFRASSGVQRAGGAGKPQMKSMAETSRWLEGAATGTCGTWTARRRRAMQRGGGRPRCVRAGCGVEHQARTMNGNHAGGAHVEYSEISE
jgi:hypothetical protein